MQSRLRDVQLTAVTPAVHNDLGGRQSDTAIALRRLEFDVLQFNAKGTHRHTGVCAVAEFCDAG